MLTREGFVTATMSGQSALQRSSWKAEAIRRGDLKISGPIPITEDTPLNDDEEREYAETGALRSPSQPQDELEHDIQPPETPPMPKHSPPRVPVEPASLTSHPVDDVLPQQESSEEQMPSTPMPSTPTPLPRMRQVVTTEAPRESVVDSASYTHSIPTRTTPENAAQAAQKKKRKSGLRGVFRKMFGRKSKAEDDEEEPGRRGHGYHQSDPGLMGRSPPRAGTVSTGPRISELPVNEPRPLHPLGQHLPFPMNVNAPQKSPPNEYLTFDGQRPDMARRRATLPGVHQTPMHRHSMDEPRGPLTPRDERQYDDRSASPGIGIALSSPLQVPTPRASRRRSRSADALHELVKDAEGNDRRRSAEIRFWRQSYSSGIAYSRPQTARTVETMRSVQIQEPAITALSEEVVAMSATLVQPGEPSPLDQGTPQREIEAPVSAFNFDLKNGTPETDHHVPASPARELSTNRLSIEDRVSLLESNYQSIELSIRRMSTRTNRQTIFLSDAPRNLRSREQMRNSSGQSASTSSSSAEETLQYPSNDTLKLGPQSPTLISPVAGDPSSTELVIEKLYEALRYERTARKALEQQVHTLQHDISDLHALVNKLIASATATSPSYPTPSPDTLIISTEEHMPTPRAEKDLVLGKGDVRESIISRFSRTDSSGSARGRFAQEELWKASRDDLASPDVWATPKEEGFSGIGFFHDGRDRSRSDPRGYS